MFDVMAGWVDDPDLRLEHAAPTALLTLQFPISVLATSTPCYTQPLSCLKTIHVRNPYAECFRQVHAWLEILQQGQHAVSLADELGNETEGDIARHGFGVPLFA